LLLPADNIFIEPSPIYESLCQPPPQSRKYT
jgi:hypothetical protein